MHIFSLCCSGDTTPVIRSGVVARSRRYRAVEVCRFGLRHLFKVPASGTGTRVRFHCDVAARTKPLLHPRQALFQFTMLLLRSRDHGVPSPAAWSWSWRSLRLCAFMVVRLDDNPLVADPLSWRRTTPGKRVPLLTRSCSSGPRHGSTVVGVDRCKSIVSH